MVMYFQRIKDLRNDADKTQQAVADFLQISRYCYWRYERGEREVPAWVIVELARYYNVSTDYILGLKRHKP